MENLHPAVLAFLVVTLIGVAGYLLKKRDDTQAMQLGAQQKLIETLFRKHDEDVIRLQELELRVVKEHYGKPELDARFLRIEQAIEKSMDNLGAKFDAFADKLNDLTTRIVAHIEKEDAGK